jgi:hypothetical protein
MKLEGKIEYIENYELLLNDSEYANKVKVEITEGAVYIAKKVIPAKKVEEYKNYLRNIGQSSLPNYQPIELGTGNFHRMNRWDERAYVKGCFHQFVFYPWNQDVFNLFEMAKPVFQIKNVLSGNHPNRFMGPNGEDDCITRLAFQFYPKGLGGLNKHQDPVDHHQLTVPIMTMSKKGTEFKEGGAFVELSNGKKVFVDDVSEPGDVIFFNARMTHGVDIIDPKEKEDWISFEGRWMLLFAINKVAGNNQIANAVDLEAKK